MPKMKIAVVPKPGADFEIQERDIPTPGTGQVRIKVQACGVCFSDHIAKDGLMPWIQYPRSPGHEIAGVVDEVGPQVTSWKKGQRVGVGWHGGHDLGQLSGAAATISPACSAVAATSSIARTKSGPGSATTVATPST